MRARVTLQRTIRQYLDLDVDRVESLDALNQDIEAKLADPLDRARLLRGQSWFEGETLDDISIAAVDPAD